MWSRRRAGTGDAEQCAGRLNILGRRETLLAFPHLKKSKKGTQIKAGGQFDTGINFTPESIWHQECGEDNLAPRV